jgi:hypothetical protein
VARVQGAITPSTGGTSGSSIAVTLGAAIGAGNAACGMITWGGNGGLNAGILSSVTDDKGNTYNPEAVLYHPIDDQYYCAYSRTNITGGPTTITANFSVSDAFRGISAEEFDSISTASSDERDVHGGQYQASPGTGTDATTSGPFTTTVNGDLLWGGVGTPSGGETEGTGFTLGVANGAGPAMFTEYRVQATAASGTAATWTSSVGGESATFLIALKPAGAAAPANLDVPAAQPILRRPPARGAAIVMPESIVSVLAAPPPSAPPFIGNQNFQPPNPITANISLNNRRSGALAAGNVGNQAAQQTFQPFGWPVQSVQPPNPATANISQNNRRAAALVGGIELGQEFPQIRFLPFGWPIQTVQPPNPNGGNLARNNTKFAALIGGIENIESLFSSAPPVLAPWWETTALPPPRPRWMRAAALEGSIEPDSAPAIRWFNAGWEVQSVQPPAGTKRLRMVVTYDGDDGTEAPFVPPVAASYTWGFDPALTFTRYARRRDLTFTESIESPAPGTFYPFGWPVQAVQPPHPAPERRFAAMAPLVNIEAVFVPPIAVPLAFYQTDYPQPPHLRRERAAAIMPFPNIEGVFTFTPPASPTMWESVWPQPPHRRPERAAAIMPQSTVEGPFSNFQPFGWHVAAPEPHPRREKAGAIAQLALVETPLTRFIPFWMMPPAHPEPHPRRERAGSIVPPLGLTEQRLQVFYPTFWHVLPPEPHPRPERGAALLPAGILPIIKFRATILNPNYIGVGSPRVMVSLGEPRQRIATGLPRNRVVLGISNNVSQTNQLTPPIDADVEAETVTFDYGLILAAGVTVTSIASLKCEVVSGTDPTPTARLLGGATIGTSPNSGGANQATFQLVGTMLGGVTYRLQCVANCSDGQIISLWNHITCQTPN